MIPDWGRLTGVLYASHRAGVLPITSQCNLDCVFCSNRFNPPGVEVIGIPPREVTEIARSLDQLAGAEKIVIGESATRICEGEPMTHPAFAGIVELVRGRYPGTPIRITTNGTLLDRETARMLSRLGDVEVTVSLNVVDLDVRSRIMGDRAPERAIRGVELLSECGVRFHGSVVAAGEAVHSLRRTIEFLRGCGALTARVMMPGYTRRYVGDTLSGGEMRALVERAVAAVRNGSAGAVDMPVTVEPPRVTDLVPRVEGVIRNSAAARAGMKRGDVILEVDGTGPESRYHAFDLMKNAGDPVVKLARDGRDLEVLLEKIPRTPPGVVMLHDIETSQVRDALDAVRRAGASTLSRTTCRTDAARPLFVTSVLGETPVRLALRASMPDARVIVARNEFFGGNIACAGLLTVEDIISSVRQHLAHGGAAAVVVVPAAPFDDRGKDLAGRSYMDIEQATGVPVAVV
ncbi:MAG: DUF512 domain-containing protein [Firmicutes bacterium]|nr:DUF512 domain-containing protein [Bacillota bacterium]